MFSSIVDRKMVGLTSEPQPGASVEMESKEPTARQVGMSKLLTMAQTMFEETANMTTKIVGKEKLNQQESELLREIGNTTFLTLQQTVVGSLGKRLSKSQSTINDVIELKYPLQITVADLRKAEKRNKNEVKRLKRKASVKDSETSE